MRKFLLPSLLLSLFVAVAATAQVRGTARLQGNVVDKSNGNPIAGATVTISLPSGNTQPIVSKTDSRGHWAALGLTSGQWNIDIKAPGYKTGRGSASVSEVRMTPSIRVELEPAVKEAPVAPSISKEAVDAIKEGEQLLKVKAGDLVTDTQSTAPGAPTAVSHAVTAPEVKENAKRAVADFEKALPMIGDDRPELADVKKQVLQVLAQAYYRAGDLKSAIATLEKLKVSDPWTTPDTNQVQRDILLTNLYLEDGQLDKGKAILDKLPATAISDPTAYTNIGILFLNKKNPADATTYFTKAIGLEPKRAENYYYRGLAEVQLKQIAEARADFQQVLTLVPDSPEAHDAKQMLIGLK